MAGFSVQGLDRLNIDLQQLAQLSDEDRWTILEAGGEVLRQAHQKYLDLHHRITGQLEASLTIRRKESSGELIARIEPKGKRRGAFTGKRWKKDRSGRRRSSGHYSGSNAEVAYFLEYGTPRMPAAHWMETANDEAADEVQAAMEAAWDAYITQRGL